MGRGTVNPRFPADLLIAALLVFAWCATAQATGIVVERGETRLEDGVFVLDADVDYELGADPSEALDNGVPLVLELEIEVRRVPDWIWREPVATLRQRYRFKFHSLTQRYLVTNLNSGDRQSFRSRGLALDYIGQVRNVPILDASLIDSRQEHSVRVRAGLDIESLPPPLLLLAYLSTSWRLNSEWRSWPL